MSGLEVLSIIANIVQLVSLGTEICTRISDAQTTLSRLPSSLHHLSIKLTALLDALESTKAALDSGSVSEKKQKNLRPALHECLAQIQILERVIAKTVPRQGAGRWRRGVKAVGSMRYDGQVKEAMGIVQGYVDVLRFGLESCGRVGVVGVDARAPSTPCTTVRIRRDVAAYVDRPDIMSQIETKCAVPAARVALVGLGGVGKTQLALEYAHRIYTSPSNSPNSTSSPTTPPTHTSVFWLYATSTTTFEDGFRKIAQAAHIAAWDEKDPEKLDVVSRWLSDEANGKWLIVIDNIDELESCESMPDEEKKKDGKKDGKKGVKEGMQPKAVTQDLLRLLPQSANGHYLITSRSKSVAYRATGDHKSIVEIDAMDEKDATTLLTNILTGPLPPADEATTLVKLLECMPLAISQAAAFINEHKPRMTLPKYIALLKKGDTDRAKLLEQDVYDARRDQFASGAVANSVLITWQISFQSIFDSRPSAARLLSLMCFFAAQGIPEDLLEGQYRGYNTTALPSGPGGPVMVPDRSWWHKRARKLSNRLKARQQSPPSDDFEEDLYTLRTYHLVAIDLSGTHFSMHALVQFATKRWLQIHDDLPFWIAHYIALLNTHYPLIATNDDPQEDHACYTLLPHAIRALECLGRNVDANEADVPIARAVLFDWTRITHKIAVVSSNSRSNHGGVGFFGTALRLFEFLKGFDDAETVQCATQLVFVLIKQKLQYAAAEPILRRLRELYERTRGLMDEKTLATLFDLRFVLGRVGKHDEADEIYRGTLARFEREYGVQDARTRKLVAQRVEQLRGLGRYDDMEREARRAFAVRKSVNGEIYDAHWAQVGYDLSICLGAFGTPEKAEAIQREALEYLDRTAEKSDPYIGAITTLLAQSLEKLGRYQEAEEMCRRRVEWSKGYDPEMPSSLMKEYARVLVKVGKPDEAEVLCRQFVEHCEKKFGRRHRDTNDFVYYLATALHAQKHYEEALLLYKEAYEVSLECSGEHHDDTEECLRDYERIQLEIKEMAENGQLTSTSSTLRIANQEASSQEKVNPIGIEESYLESEESSEASITKDTSIEGRLSFDIEENPIIELTAEALRELMPSLSHLPPLEPQAHPPLQSSTSCQDTHH